jgi:hypothetical protein
MSAMHWPWPDAFWNRKIVKTGAVHIITRKIPVCGAKRNVKPVNTALQCGPASQKQPLFPINRNSEPPAGLNTCYGKPVGENPKAASFNNGEGLGYGMLLQKMEVLCSKENGTKDFTRMPLAS